MTLGPMPDMVATEALIRDKINRCLRADEAKELIERLREKRRQEFIQLIGARDPIDIGRSQGKIEILNWLLQLREE